MDTITYTDARQHFKSAMEKVCADRAPLIITRQDAEPVVMMSLADYHAMEETFYLLKSPKNAARLMEAFTDAKRGKRLMAVEFSDNDLIPRKRKRRMATRRKKSP